MKQTRKKTEILKRFGLVTLVETWNHNFPISSLKDENVDKFNRTNLMLKKNKSIIWFSYFKDKSDNIINHQISNKTKLVSYYRIHVVAPRKNSDIIAHCC